MTENTTGSEDAIIAMLKDNPMRAKPGDVLVLISAVERIDALAERRMEAVQDANARLLIHHFNPVEVRA